MGRKKYLLEKRGGGEPFKMAPTNAFFLLLCQPHLARHTKDIHICTNIFPHICMHLIVPFKKGKKERN